MGDNKLKKTVIGLVICLAIGLYATLPLFGKGFIPTHDGEYHIIRFQQFFVMLSHGYWFPRWAPDLNSGYGVPVFNFNYPLPNYVGALFHWMRLSFIDSFKASLAFGYLLAIVGCFFWLKSLVRFRSATIATVIASVVPYWFVDIYVRGSIGEVWAFTWVYWAFWAIEVKNTLLLGLFMSFLILSHNIMAMVFFPILFSYAFIRNRKMLLGLSMSVFIAAYFWIPALMEQKYVIGLNTVNFRDHFPYLFQLLIPSWGTGLSGRSIIANQMSFQIGIMPIVLLVISLFYFRGVKSSLKYVYIIFIGISIISFVLMQDVSAPVWEHMALLQYIQYPWRLLSIFIPITAFISAIVIERLRNIWVILLCLVAVALSLSYMRPVVYAPRTDSHYLTSPNFTDGTSSMGNAFSTKWSPWQQVRPQSKIQAETQGITVQDLVIQPLSYSFTTISTQSSSLRINTVYYPGWKAETDRTPLAITYQKGGIIRLTLPKGSHSVRVFFSETRLRVVADAVSLIGLFCLFISSILVTGYENRTKRRINARRT